MSFSESEAAMFLWVETKVAPKHGGRKEKGARSFLYKTGSLFYFTFGQRERGKERDENE